MKIVALDLPTSHMMLKADDPFTGRMFDAVNEMLLAMLAAIARKDYDDRRRRQAGEYGRSVGHFRSAVPQDHARSCCARPPSPPTPP